MTFLVALLSRMLTLAHIGIGVWGCDVFVSRKDFQVQSRLVRVTPRLALLESHIRLLP